MLKERVVFVGIGQGGGNITRELELKGCQCYYVNTSLDDLDTIDTEYDKKYHISGTKGMAKDIEYANKVITSDENDDKIVESIYKKYANASIYFFVFTSSGGSGGAMSPQIAKKMKERYPDKIVNAITVKPHAEEDMVMQYNSIQCLNKIKSLLDANIITSVQILDNNKRDFNKKTAINRDYADMLDKILSYADITSEGNLDEEEFERLFTVKGMTIIHEISNKEFLDDLNDADENSLFATNNKNPEVHGLILNIEQDTSINRNLIREVFGIPKLTHDTIWDDKSNIIVATGMTFNDSVISELKKSYLDLKTKKEQLESSLNIEVDNIDVDFGDIKSLSTKTKPIDSDRSNTRTRRRVGARHEVRR